MSTGKWEREVDEIVSKFYPPTKISGQDINKTPLSGQSFFDVWELDLDRQNKEKPLIISGNDAFIALQASLLRAVDQLLTARGLQAFDFNEWKEAFENGYSEFTTGASNELKKLWADGMVYKDAKKDIRPKIVEIKVHGNSKKLPTFKVVQFFPNRSVKNEWVLFSGSSYREIALQVENWWNQKASDGTGSKSKGGSLPYMKGQPLITLFFAQDSNKVGKNSDGTRKSPDSGEISFRIMDKSDDPNHL